MSLDGDPAELGAEGYTIQSNSTGIAVQAAGDAGLLYAAFRLIREMQCGNSLERLMIKEVPAYDLRILNHWDDLDGHIERGYAGTSLWKWNELPETLDPRYEDYARANASIGINGVVLNNVNADPRILRRDYLKKVAALADVFRGYNIRVYLTANFAAPLSSPRLTRIFAFSKRILSRIFGDPFSSTSSISASKSSVLILPE